MRPEDDRAFRVLHDETEPLMRRLDAVSRLAAAEDPAVVVPLAALCGEAGGPLRDALLRAVGKLDARAVLTRSLAGADGERRRTIARLLGGIGERAACPALVDLMQDDPDPRVREEAAGALARLCDPSTLAPLLRRLEEDSDRYVRAAAAQALGEIGGEAAARALEQARGREEHPSVRMLIGPEGGFSPREAAQARDAGYEVVSLGPRLLKVPTAALAALTLIQYAWGDLA